MITNIHAWAKKPGMQICYPMRNIHGYSALALIMILPTLRHGVSDE